MKLTNDYDKEKIVECMFDPVTSLIIAELEDGEKSGEYLAEKSSIPESEVKERLTYLLTHEFILEKKIENQSFFSANVEKLTRIVEDKENFGAAVEGLEKMDSFLN